jgi:Spy/CpxP family protein refolding chaperone
MKKTLLLAASMVIASIPFIFAESGEGPIPGMHEGQEIGSPEIMMEKGLTKALGDLKLTEQQEQKLREIRDSSKRDMMVLRHEIQLAILDIQEEYKNEKTDPVKINSCIDKLSEAQKKMMKLRSAQMLKMKLVLTPEQFKQLLKKIDNSKNKMKKGFFDKLKGKN